MKKQIKILIYVIMAISLITCGYVGFERIQTETHYNNVEVAIKYSDILRIADESNVAVEDVLRHYKKLGVTNLLVKEMTVASAIEADYSSYKGLGEINLVDGYILRFNFHNATELKPEQRYIVSSNKDVVDNILNNFSAKGIELENYFIDDTYFIEIGDKNGAITGIGVGFDAAGLNVAADMGYQISLQLKNWDDPTDESIDLMINEISAINNVDTIYFSDAKVPATDKKAFTDFLENYQIGFIEFSSNKQEGFSTLVKATNEAGKNYKVVRLHTIEDNKLANTSIEDLLNRYDLALNERNNRAFLFKLPTDINIKQDVEYLDESIVGFIEDAQESGYTITSDIANYNLALFPRVVPFVAGLASIMIFILFMDALGFTKTGYVLAVVGTLGYGALLLKGYTDLACQLMALFGTVMFPTYALVKCINKEGKNIRDSILTLLMVCMISFGGALTIIGCLSRTVFALGIKVFLGVKVATVLPIVLVLFYLIFTEHKYDFKYYKGILDKKISYGALILLGILAVVLYVYVSRTGNTGTATGLERSFRQFLDTVLGVRPRTKEFLIGYPVLLALLYYGYKEKYIVTVIFAIIGATSLVNTYAHIHTPVMISLIRSAYGIVFGIIVGLILIGVIKLISKVIKKCQTQLK